MPGLVIEESDDETGVEFKLKAVEGTGEAFERMVKRVRLKPLSKEFVYNDDILDLDSGGLSSENILRESSRTEDLVVNASSLKSDSVK
jgi:hypothetical protein